MKYLKTYENFKPSKDWQIGDIIVAKNGIKPKNLENFSQKYSHLGRLIVDHKYTIVDIKDTSKNGQTPDRFPISVSDENGVQVVDFSFNDYEKKVPAYFLKDNFITLEEWELKNAIKKYNI